ncbi:MAG: redox-regulated ATPase YchF [Nitrospirae bacterium GWF2_44_13]|nr:MAG: redox-regulated ATPase YchF [Nitrospirae bacterium GWF2_44_13]OGW33095.1 MAG: redox-regulated ATPase YchF [Nitrospirae bacterium GWD2_44_7]OGW63693.1 MAG: redox-regulated ATPase YchF [Nitrospirae bacterium RIFOXYA2_FULL_44_9]OGW71542.1 MAG: redox-regulated ATPase YchF [Nitrospirae bacterium RIFOXYC2_FULL_44_7]HBG92921.1 redox-regulated ATPase YchF [Nitrospiraceae bacterium]
MKIAVTGLANSGKTTIFNALTGLNLETTIYPTLTAEPHLGVVKVPDSRIEKLADIYKPKKTTYATVEYVDYIGITKGDIEQNKKVSDLIKDVDAVVHVVRGFEDESIVHPLGNVNPARDAETVELEMIFGDLELVEKRLERMEQGQKRGKKPDETEKKILLKCKEVLEKETPLRDIEFSEEEQKTMRNLQFMSIKPVVIVLNIPEKDLNSEKTVEAVSGLQKFFKGKQVKVLSLCGKIEMEIAQLSPEEADAFLNDLGIQEPALNKLIHVSYGLLGLISFLTVGEDEVRAWTVKKGTDAQKAAGKIHSDIERGFIRGEVVSFDDFISNGSMSAARDKGLLRLEGKTYEVKDGDIINFRFNV